MRRKVYAVAIVAALVSTAGLVMPTSANAATCTTTAYDNLVLAAHPVAYWPLAGGQATGPDCAGNHTITFVKGPGRVTLPNGDFATQFNGLDQYAQAADANDLSITNTGILTIEAWMRPDTLQFPKPEPDKGYVHWMGKGVPNQHEWVARMYSLTNPENRPNRISGYAFNLPGNLGVGSYFQDKVNTTDWIHYTLVINTVNVSSTYPIGYTRIYKNGEPRDIDDLSALDIRPGNGTAPVRIGSRDLVSFFQGRIGKVAIYPYELSGSTIMSHYNLMT